MTTAARASTCSKPVERVNGGSASTRALVLEPFPDSLPTVNPVDGGGKSLKH
jgi:hypothetical protein